MTHEAREGEAVELEPKTEIVKIDNRLGWKVAYWALALLQAMLIFLYLDLRSQFNENTAVHKVIEDKKLDKEVYYKDIGRIDAKLDALMTLLFEHNESTNNGRNGRR